MISKEEEFRIKILRYFPENIAFRFFEQNSGSKYKDGYDHGRQFLEFLKVLNTTELAKKKEYLSNHAGECHFEYDFDMINSIFRHILSGKRKEFVIGFMRYVMMLEQSELKNSARHILFESGFFTAWFEKHGSELEDMTRHGLIDSYIKELEQE